MSEKLGPLNYARKETSQDFMMGPFYSTETEQLIDSEIRRIVLEQYQRVKELLETNKALLKRVAEALLEKETLHAEDMMSLLKEGNAGV